MHCVSDISYISGDGKSPLTSHAHANLHQILYICGGRVTVTVCGRAYDVDSPSLVLISRLESHSVEIKSANYKRYSLTLNPELFEKNHGNILTSALTARSERFCHVIPVGEDGEWYKSIFDMAISEFHSSDKADVNGLDALITAMLLRLYRVHPETFVVSDGKSCETVSMLKEILSSNLAFELTLEEVSAQSHMSLFYLAHIFKSLTGYSPMHYRLLCRLSAAREMIENSELPISEIAKSVGFEDMSHFSRCFKRESGMTPSQYRSNIQAHRDGIIPNVK